MDEFNLRPTTFGLHSHFPPLALQMPETEPVGSHSHFKLWLKTAPATGQMYRKQTSERSVTGVSDKAWCRHWYWSNSLLKLNRIERRNKARKNWKINTELGININWRTSPMSSFISLKFQQNLSIENENTKFTGVVQQQANHWIATKLQLVE